VLFWALDRFSREGVFETLNHLQRLSAWGVEWRSYQEVYLDSCGPFKDFVVSLMATLAKQERVRISEGTKAGLQGARRAGKGTWETASRGRRGEAQAIATRWPIFAQDCRQNRAELIDGCEIVAISSVASRDVTVHEDTQ